DIDEVERQPTRAACCSPGLEWKGSARGPRVSHVDRDSVWDLLAAEMNQICRQAEAGVRDARDRPKIFVNGSEVVVGHVAIDRPWHDLKQVGVEGRRSNATQHSHCR